MAIALFMDAHIPKAITNGLRLRGVDVITAQEDNATDISDFELLNRATALQRVLFTFDRHLVIEAVQRQRKGDLFAGVIYAHPLRVSVGTCIRDLEIITKGGKPEDLANRVEFLPL